jgi:hypothetical protein
MAYDRADWHYDGDFPAALPREAGGTHIAMFLCWMMLQGHVGPDHMDDRNEVLTGLTNRSLTPGQWFFKWCDGKFCGSDLDEIGNQFAEYYYCEEGKYKQYISDYDNLFSEYGDLYSVPDTWESFDRLSPIIRNRYHDWKKPPSIWKRLFL